MGCSRGTISIDRAHHWGRPRRGGRPRVEERGLRGDAPQTPPMERATGFEPATSGLGSPRATIALRPRGDRIGAAAAAIPHCFTATRVLGSLFDATAADTPFEKLET